MKSNRNMKAQAGSSDSTPSKFIQIIVLLGSEHKLHSSPSLITKHLLQSHQKSGVLHQRNGGFFPTM